MQVSGKPPTLRFSTAELPERDRLTLYREIFGRGVVNMDITPLDENSWAEAELRALPGASIMWGSNSAFRYEKLRGGALETDDILLVWASGAVVPGMFRHLGKEIVVQDGTTVLMSCEHDAVAENLSPIRHVNLKIQRASLAPLVRNIDDALMRPIRPDAAAMRLLKSYVGTIRNASWDSGIEQAAVLHICDLIALAVGTGRDAMEQARHRGARAARLDAIRKFVQANLANPNLSINDVARAQGVTPRYVQMLFEGEGTTLSAYVLEQRLSSVHRLLQNVALADKSIGAIALDAGFGDISYFNQAFRRRFGKAPSDVRHRAVRNRQGG